MRRSDPGDGPRLEQPFSPLALAGFLLALLAALLLLVAGPGSRWGWWNFRTGFDLLRWAAYGGIAAAALSLVALVRSWSAGVRLGLPFALLGLLLGLGVAAIPFWLRRTASSVPPIHDVTTDPADPPEFVDVLPLRQDAPNPAEYGGEEIAAQQREAYPDLAPLLLPVAPAQAFGRALAAARGMGWEIVAAEPAAGRIEATATTRWFGFEDDVVVRLTPVPEGTRVDVRSVSRIGKGDAGANAKRIRAYLGRLRSGAAR